MEKLKKFKHLRNVCLGDMEALITLSEKAKTDRSVRTLFKVRCADIQEIYDDFLKHHNNVCSTLLTDPENELEDENIIRQAFLKDYYDVKASYTELFEQEPLVTPHNSTILMQPNTMNNNYSNIRLPQIELSKFNGDYKTFVSFIDQYNAMVHDNPSLSNVAKFNYLLSTLQGPPASLVRTLPLSSDNYLIAYDTLVERYSNKRLRAQAHWDEIENTCKINSETPAHLRKLIDIFSENLSALKTLGFPTEEWDFILTMMVLKRLDTATVTSFEMEHRSTDVPTYKDLMKFLNNRCIVLDTLTNTTTSSSSSRPLKNVPQKAHTSSPRTTSLFVNKTPARSPASSCALCKDTHSLYTCSVFAQKSPRDRHSFCKSQHLCFNCLSSSHDLRSCRSTYACKKCHSRSHHTLLHMERATGGENSGSSTQSTPNRLPANPEVIPRQVNNSEPSYSSTLAATGVISGDSSVLLSTALIEVCDKLGNFLKFRCLLDSGSMTSFISRKAVTRLGLRKSTCSIEVKGLGSMQSNINNGLVSLSLKPLGKDNPMLYTDAIILNKICDKLPAISLPVDNWAHIRNLQLADPNFHLPGNIDLLLGADIFSKIILSGSISGRSDDPIAINTILGFILMGTVKLSTLPSVSSFFCNATEDTLENIIKKFWEIESVPNVINAAPEDILCEKSFKDTCFRDETGRYTVSLPFRENNPSFPGMRDYALSRFYSLERRLLKTPEIYSQYCDFMREYIQLNHMEIIKESNIPSHSYYLVHHCVLKPESQSTKLRVVFNASAKLPNKKSLNECLMVGPKLQQDISHILLNFCLYPYVLCADIKQMYRMIWMNPLHTDYQRILWRFSPNDNIQDFRLRTLTYGLSPAPFQALRCLRQLCDDEGHEFPLAVEAIRNSSYIDDVVVSVPTLDEAIALRRQLVSIMQKGGFELRKWCSNEPSLLSDLPESHLSTSPLTFDSDCTESSLKVHGLQWNPVLDYFFFTVKLRNTRTCTKRVMLSELGRAYDPLGHLSPITFYTKHLIQRLWTLGIGWDESPSDDIVRVWQQYISELPLLSGLRIPRLVIPPPISGAEIVYELHGFCDASEKGYACVIYIRSIDQNSRITTHFLYSKSKVASIKKITIPRLELCAAVLLSKVMSFVLRCVGRKITFHHTYAWSDSQITLYWIKGPPHRWTTFVANRVTFIHENLPVTTWQYVKTKENPADVASRGLLPSALMAHDVWFSGPSLLHDLMLPLELPPLNFVYPVEDEKKLVFFVAPQINNMLEQLLNKKSSFSSLQRLVSYILRFISNVKNPATKEVGPLQSHELHASLILLVKYTQQVHFANELENKVFSRPLRKLNVFSDDDGVLRVGGRLKHAHISYDAKHPMLLPRQSSLTVLLIRYYHEKYFHCGFRTTQFLLSQTFWILSSKRAINSIISKCIRCWKTNPSTFQPPMASLPPSRLIQVKPFLHSAVDLEGPFFITLSRHRGVKTSEAYLCIFVCFATKAVHLELASDLSSEIFLAALQRFVARRGRVTHLHCDNATNFVGASREINLMKTAADQEKIKFVFSPPSGPHFNGLAEAGVKSAKSHISKVIGDQILTFEEFSTLLCFIESLLNSRPLTPISSDIEDINALTPGHFLTLEPLSALPTPNYSQLPLNRLSRWQLLQRLQQDFWKRWQREYLHTLQQRGKWLDPSTPPDIGALVLIKDENHPPSKWTLARIIAVHPGDDHIVRVATVRTSSGELKRPLVKLCPLPVSQP